MKEVAILSARVEKSWEGMRLDLFLASAFPGISRKRAKRLIDGRFVSVNGRIEHMASRELKTGELVEARVEEASRDAEPPQRLGLLWRDGPLAALDKPPGLVSGATRDASRQSAEKLASALLGSKARLLHRLDRDTSGALLVALDETGAKALYDAFKKRDVAKTYLAIVSGAAMDEFEDSCHLKEAKNSRVIVVTSGGVKAETAFKTLARANGFSLVKAMPKTGRMHQIRAQLSRLGHPIAGDALYGGAAGAGDLHFGRQMLHAFRIGFRHPFTGKWTIVTSPPPEDFAQAAETIFGKGIGEVISKA